MSLCRNYTNEIVAHQGQADPQHSARMAATEDELWGTLIEYRAELQEVQSSGWIQSYQWYLVSKVNEQLVDVKFLKELPETMPDELHYHHHIIAGYHQEMELCAQVPEVYRWVAEDRGYIWNGAWYVAELLIILHN